MAYDGKYRAHQCSNSSLQTPIDLESKYSCLSKDAFECLIMLVHNKTDDPVP